MTQLVTTLLTIAAMTAHAVFGCCWHHDHLYQLSSAGEHHAGVQPSACHEVGHDRDVTHNDRADLPAVPDSDGDNHDGQPCDEGRCLYLASQQLVKPVDCVHFPVFGLAPDSRAADSGGLPRCGRMSAISFEPSRYSQGQRVHALVGVWLI